MNFKGALLALATFVAAQPAIAQQDNFADEHPQNRNRSHPSRKSKRFICRPGFEAQLVASEPDIGKPMNMAFDSKGRLVGHPYRASIRFLCCRWRNQAAIEVVVIENFDANGRAHKFTTFKTGLNIPIGLYPYKDGVLAFQYSEDSFF